LYSFSKTYTEDKIYERDDLVGIDIKDSQIYCKKRDASNEACSITIRLTKPDTFTGIRMTDHSTIAGQRVFINSPSTQLIIDETSSIDTSGRSRGNVGSDKENKRGASFMGEGGYCGDSKDAYKYGVFS
jgi:hypothetical protein